MNLTLEMPVYSYFIFPDDVNVLVAVLMLRQFYNRLSHYNHLSSQFGHAVITATNNFSDPSDHCYNDVLNNIVGSLVSVMSSNTCLWWLEGIVYGWNGLWL